MLVLSLLAESTSPLWGLHPVDAFCVAFLGFHALMGLVRGFVFQLLRVATWSIGILLSRRFSGDLAAQFAAWQGIADDPSNATPRVIAWFVILFLTVVAGLIALKLAQSVVSKWKLGGFDRILGFFFGAAKAALIVIVCMVAALAIARPFDLDEPLARSRAAQWSGTILDRSGFAIPDSLVADYKAWLAAASTVAIAPPALGDALPAGLPGLPGSLQLPNTPVVPGTPAAPGAPGVSK